MREPSPRYRYSSVTEVLEAIDKIWPQDFQHLTNRGREDGGTAG
jgi:hypothetical protein